MYQQDPHHPTGGTGEDLLRQVGGQPLGSGTCVGDEHDAVALTEAPPAPLPRSRAAVVEDIAMRALEAVSPTESRLTARHVARRSRGGRDVATQRLEHLCADLCDRRRLSQPEEAQGEDALDIEAGALGGDEPVDHDPGDIAQPLGVLVRQPVELPARQHEQLAVPHRAHRCRAPLTGEHPDLAKDLSTRDLPPGVLLAHGLEPTVDHDVEGIGGIAFADGTWPARVEGPALRQGQLEVLRSELREHRDRREQSAQIPIAFVDKSPRHPWRFSRPSPGRGPSADAGGEPGDRRIQPWACHATRATRAATTTLAPGPDGGIGRRGGLKSLCPQGRGGSSPPPGTERIPC